MQQKFEWDMREAHLGNYMEHTHIEPTDASIPPPPQVAQMQRRLAWDLESAAQDRYLQEMQEQALQSARRSHIEATLRPLKENVALYQKLLDREPMHVQTWRPQLLAAQRKLNAAIAEFAPRGRGGPNHILDLDAVQRQADYMAQEVAFAAQQAEYDSF